jgi:hypothetical protein
LFFKHDFLNYFLYCKCFYLTVPAVFPPKAAPTAAAGGAHTTPKIEPTNPPKDAPKVLQTNVAFLGLWPDAISVNKQQHYMRDKNSQNN